MRRNPRDQRVIKRTNVATGFPLFPSITTWLLLDRLQPAGWIWGVVLTLTAIVWAIHIHAIITEKPVDIFED